MWTKLKRLPKDTFQLTIHELSLQVNNSIFHSEDNKK